MGISDCAACTIVSRNYFPYARTIAESFRKYSPGVPFYVLLVDEPGTLDLAEEPFETILVRDIGIKNFLETAFKFDILELNTAVKPSFLKYLIQERGADRVLYFDPDISFFGSPDFLFDRLKTESIIFTPHITKSIEDSSTPTEQDFLHSGVFNLGFLGVSKSLTGSLFLDWWERRCLVLGYSDVKNGLFVDQKWANLVPCLFDSVAIEKHAGCNMAYWNLHERIISEQGGRYMVNDHWPLVFFHFSGISPEGQDLISKYTNRFTLSTRPDIVPLFEQYRASLERHQIREMRGEKYAYGYFSNGRPILKIARTVFSFFEERYRGDDPFDANGRFYKDASRWHLLADRDTSIKYNLRNIQKEDWRIRLINRGLRMILRIFGPDRYSMFIKYLSYIAISRNQRDLFLDLS